MIGLGIDGGGTKTEALLLDAAGRILGMGRSGPVNTFFVSEREALAAMCAAVDAARAAAGPVEIAALAASAEVPDDLLDELSRTYHIPRWRHLEEPESARAAGQLFAGVAIRVVVCAGTGSMAMGVGEGDERPLAGAAGPLVGDEGSAYWLGQRALAALFHALDGRGDASLLTGRLPAHLGAPADFWPLIRRVYGPPAMSRAEIAALAPLVTQAAAEGDVLALELVRTGASELARLVYALGKRLGLLAKIFGVLPYGGVFRAGPVILEPFRDEVRAIAPHADVLPPVFHPVLGAATLALACAGHRSLSKAALQTLRVEREKWRL
ncbi:MAG: hypothetical protein JXB47_06195 [Anaerolineae bacterium]|nr:hypothetical protein [Anaerolineae bacterium]